MITNGSALRFYTMPRYMPLEWKDKGLVAKIKPTGIRKVLPLPYFSGTLLQLKLVVHNSSYEIREIRYKSDLFRLSGTTHQPADPIKCIEGHFEIRPNSDDGQKLRIAYLPQPGNYSFKLQLVSYEKEPKFVEGDMVYFDARARDASTLNIWMLLASAIIGGIIGYLLGSLW